MPRKRVPNIPDRPYHVSARCINREWFQLPMHQVWSIMSDYLYLAHHCFSIQIHSFVLMNNHFHMIAAAPAGNLSEAMNYFMREVSRVIGFETGRINQVWGGPHHKTLIQSQQQFLHTYKYVYRNPVEAGIVDRAEDYPYSTLPRLLGSLPCTIPLVEDTLLMSDPERCLKWLNTSYQPGQRELIRKALRRSEFRLPETQGTNEMDESIS
jgi:putative transposase